MLKIMGKKVSAILQSKNMFIKRYGEFIRMHLVKRLSMDFCHTLFLLIFLGIANNIDPDQTKGVA